MIRVLYLSAPTALAGAERVILNYLGHYDPSQFEIIVASYLNPLRFSNPYTEAVEATRFSFEKITIGPTPYVKQIRETIKIIKSYSIDIIHTHGYRSDVAGLIAAKLTGTPIVSTVHGWTSVSLKLRAYQMLDRFCLKRFDRIVCVSNLLHQEFSKLGINSERLVYLPNAVSLPEKTSRQRDTARQQLVLESGEKVVVAVGRLSPEKGLDILLTAFARQFSSDRGVRLILVGDGPERAALESLALGLGIAEQVVFAGFISDVAGYYAAADLFVMSSHTEGFPMALLEAMAWELPVLATAVGGIPDIVQDGVNGCLVPPGSVEPLAAAMANLLGNRGLAESMGQAARQTIAERFAADQWARALENVYSGVYEKRRS